uniref:Flagellar hook-length control protein FliK n=1 Tax=Neobacillus citreus TaxID=2833578 RepID=A0A942YAJ6_9BACI
MAPVALGADHATGAVVDTGDATAPVAAGAGATREGARPSTTPGPAMPTAAQAEAPVPATGTRPVGTSSTDAQPVGAPTGSTTTLAGGAPSDEGTPTPVPPSNAPATTARDTTAPAPSARSTGPSAPATITVTATATAGGPDHVEDGKPTGGGEPRLQAGPTARGGEPIVAASTVVPTASPSAVSAPTAVTAPSAPAPLAQQLVRPLFTLAHAPGEHVVTVHVTPDTLGPVTVRAHVTAHGMHVELFAASDAGRDAVRQVLPDLRRDAGSTGVATTLDLSAQNHPGGQPERRGSGPSAPRPDTGQEARPAAADRPAPVPTTVRTAGLDVLA